MQFRKRLALWLGCGLLALSVNVAFAQNYTMKLYVSDGTTSDSVTLGVNTLATYGKDAGLGEAELPPVPPSGVFDVRSIDLDGRTALGQGQELDLRTYVSLAQADTYKIRFQPSTEAGPSALVFSWGSGLSALGAGRWRLLDALYGGLGLNIDMTNQTSANVAQVYGPYVYIISSDKYVFRSMTAADIYTSVDPKGKQKAVKQKPYASDSHFTFTNNSTIPQTELKIKFGQNITSIISVSNGWTYSSLPAKEVTFTGSAIAPNGTLLVECMGDKGKANTGKGTWNTTSQSSPKVVKTVGVAVSDLRLPMPNYHNMIAEVYSQGGFGANGLEVGVSPKNIIHPKPGDVLKSLDAKGTHHTGAARCLDVSVKGKPIVKTSKTFAPGKVQDNALAAAAIMLKLNIAASDKAKTPGGFGDLEYVSSDSLNGKTVRAISAQLDAVLACDSSQKGGILSFTYADWLAAANAINAAFSGAFDTTQWGGKLILTGVRPVSDVGFLHRNPNIAPFVPPVGKSIEAVQPTAYKLNQNYPNPFNPTTTIAFELPEDAFVTIKVYNMIGQEVATVVNHEEFTEGVNEVDFDASTLSSGVYYYRLIVNDGQFQQVNKMMLMK